MAIRSNLDMLANLDGCLQGRDSSLEAGLQSELDMILRAHQNRRAVGRQRELHMYRSGSAPPTVEGSLSAVGSLFRNYDNLSSVSNSSGRDIIDLTEDEIRMHPDYLSYYYSHDNINPRLPLPLLSKEDWRVAQRFQAAGSSFGGVGDFRKKLADERDSSSLFSMQPGFSVQKAENDLMELRNSNDINASSNGLTGAQRAMIGPRRKSFADILQEGLDRPASLSRNLSSSSSHNALCDMMNAAGISAQHLTRLSNGAESFEGLLSGAAAPGFGGKRNHGATISQSLAPPVGSSLPRSTTPEQHLVPRSSNSVLPPLGTRAGPIDKNSVGLSVQNGYSSGMTDFSEIADTLSCLSLLKTRHAEQEICMPDQMQLGLENQPYFHFKKSNGHNQSLQQQLADISSAANLSFSANYTDVARKNGVTHNLNVSKIPKRTYSSANLHSKVNSSGIGNSGRSNARLQNANIASIDFMGHIPGDYSVNQKLDSVIKNCHDAASALGGNGVGDSFYGLGNQVGIDLRSPVMDPRYAQYLQKMSEYASPSTGSTSFPQVRNYFDLAGGDLEGIKKAYLEALLAQTQQNQQYELPFLGKAGSLSQGCNRNPLHGLCMPYPHNSMANPILQSAGSGSFQSDRVAQLTSMMRNSMGGPIGPWNSDVGGNPERRHGSSLVDEFKNNKSRSFELADIIGHVVEFSMDQHGSRFIQQKLETATVEEKNKIFPEITPHACALMTDVFGNYVIQKFFDHGTESQKMELARQLSGHVMPLSLQMYGCRVIQKALEMIHVDLKTQLAKELDGSVMKCIRDQNGNHVIQKCIECVPEDRIQFIISAFYGQVVPLSTHPYGCRVIQRVLEHCADVNTQEIIMDEILQSVCNLAQDQYGNYVIQHVLQHGKPHERTTIISKLAGQIVKMSQQKFASNVVEKCLTFSGPEERQILVNEMLGSTDENEPLQAMMKDPFGNYVVQKVIETCDDQSLELILSRIKVHLSALKRYTYGKHIVSRVEKLIMTGERRLGSLSVST